MIGAIAQATKTLQLGTGVTCPTMRIHPAIIIYTLPDELPPIMVAASGPKAATAAGRMGDGLISTAPDKEVIAAFAAADGEGPRYDQLTVCWAASEAEARHTAFEIWPNAGLTGQLSQEIRTVTHSEQACKMLTEQSATEELACGPDAAQYIEKIQKFADAGYDHVYLHQVGPDQEGFFRFCEREILPHFT